MELGYSTEYLKKAFPLDMVFSQRHTVVLASYFPNFVQNVWRKKLKNRFDHKKYSMEPEYGPFQAQPTVNDELPNKLIAGTVKIKADVADITETDVKFIDGTVETGIDAIILGTGYIFGFPFWTSPW